MTRLVMRVPHTERLSSWQLRYRAGLLELDQEHHLRVIKEQLQDRLSVYVHTDWARLSDIVKHIDTYTTEFVFVALNLYLLEPEQIADCEDYLQAVTEVLSTAQHYRLIQTESQQDTTGSVGNFVFPDTRFLLCKRQ